jgi:hypothetical protein
VVSLVRPGLPPDAWIEVKRHADPTVDLGRPIIVHDAGVISADPDAYWQVEPDGSVSRMTLVGEHLVELTFWAHQRELRRDVWDPQDYPL